MKICAALFLALLAVFLAACIRSTTCLPAKMTATMRRDLDASEGWYKNFILHDF